MHNSNLLKHMKKKMEGQKVFQLTNWTHIDIPSGTFHKKSVYISALSRRSLHFLFVFLCNFTGQRHFIQRQFIFTGCTGKSLILASTNNPQYDKRLFIDLPVQYMKTTELRTCCVYKLFSFFFVLTFKSIYVHNMFWACIAELVNQHW